MLTIKRNVGRLPLKTTDIQVKWSEHANID